MSQSQDGLEELATNYPLSQSQEASETLMQQNISFFTPLGKPSKKTIHEAKAILDKIQQHIDDYNNNVLIRDLSNQFYQLIPQQNATSNLQLIENRDILKEKYRLLQVLESS